MSVLLLYGNQCPSVESHKWLYSCLDIHNKNVESIVFCFRYWFYGNKNCKECYAKIVLENGLVVCVPSVFDPLSTHKFEENYENYINMSMADHRDMGV